MVEPLNVDTRFGNVFGMSAGSPGSPLILGIHGWSQRNGWHTWQPLLEPLGAGDFFAYSVDMPGWGNSKKPGQPQLTTVDAVAAVVDIVSALEKKQVILMGKSWGGGVALQAALDHPELVSRLILSAPAYRNLDGLRVLKQPVLMAWAENDPVIPINYSAEYEKVIPSLKLVKYKHGGHSAAAKNVDDFVPQVLSFLSN